MKKCKICETSLEDIPNRYKYCSDECHTKQKNKDNRMYQLNWRRKKEGKEPITKDDMIECELCEKLFVQLGTHVQSSHNMSAREYKKRFGLDVSKGLVPDWYHEEKSRETIENKSWAHLPEVGKETRFKPGSTRAGRYERSEETKQRLKEHGKKVLNND